MGHGPRRRAGRPRLRARWSPRACPPRTTSTWSSRRCARPSRRSMLLRRPGLGADRAGRSWPTRARAALAAAEPGQRLPAAPGPASFAAAARSRTDLAVLAGWLRGDGRPGRPDHRAPTCAGASCRRWSPTARPARPRSRPSWTATARPAASGRRPSPARWSRPPSRRPRPGAGSPRTTRCRTGCSARCCGGFQHPAQIELTAPVRGSRTSTRDRPGLGDAATASRRRSSWSWRTRRTRSSEETVARTDAWLASAGQPGAAAPAGRRGPRRHRAGAEGAGQGRRRVADAARRRAGRPRSSERARLSCRRLRRLRRLCSAGVVGELGQAGDEAAGQVAAAERRRHRQRRQLRRAVGQPAPGLVAGDDLQHPLVGRDRDEHAVGGSASWPCSFSA